jgi:hypothetical protein
MSQETARPATRDSRPGLDDFCGQRKSGPSISQKVLQEQAQRRLCRQRQVERLHALGARVVFELLDELDRHHRLGDDLDRRLDRYASLDPALVAAVGADRFPHPALRIVGVSR